MQVQTHKHVYYRIYPFPNNLIEAEEEAGGEEVEEWEKEVEEI